MCDRCKDFPSDKTCEKCFRTEGQNQSVYGNVTFLCSDCWEKKKKKLVQYGLRRPEIDIIMTRMGIKTSCCNAEPYSSNLRFLCGKCNRDVTTEMTIIMQTLVKKKKKERIVN